jgi:alpha-mannosidase
MTENGPLLARLCIRVEWSVPSAYDFSLGRRSSTLVPLVVEHRVTLRKGSGHVEIETTVHNTPSDHRLRLFCPTRLAQAESFWADTAFDAVERPVKLRQDRHLARELQVEMTPQQNWVATTDGQRGLALLAPGQYESAVLDQSDRPLCLTLLRGFRRAVFTDGNEGGQIHGVHKFRMALKPFDGAVPATALYQIAQSLAAAPHAEFLDIQELADMGNKKELRAVERPAIAGNVVLSSSALEEGRWIFRVFNPTDKQETVQLVGAESWEITDLRGGNPKPVCGKSTTIAPRQILTLRASARGIS